MKVRVLVEVLGDGGEKVRRLQTVDVSPKAAKLYESFGSLDFIAEDVMSGALAAVQSKAMPSAALDAQASLPGKDPGNTMLEDSLGLDIVENMLKKDGAGAAQSQPQFSGSVPVPPPLRRR